MHILKIKYHTDGVEVGQAHPGEWVDVRAAEKIEMKAGMYRLIPLGFSCALPDGYEAILAARSSTFKKYGFILANGFGVIDSLYRGNDDEWMVAAYAVNDVAIPKGERIAQFRIQEVQPDLTFITVEDLGDGNRGGFGSTGSK